MVLNLSTPDMEIRGKVYLTKEGSKLVANGELNIYSQWIRKVEGKPPRGSLVEIFDLEEKRLGKGFYENIGAIGVRLLSYEDEPITLQTIIDRICKAEKFRKERLRLRSFYRIINADGDLMPGMIVDKYEDIIVIQSSSIGFDKILEPLAKAILRELNAQTVYAKNDQRSRREVGLNVWRGTIAGERKTRTLVEEGAAKFYVDVEKGQKTGFFIDQRYNRIELEKYVSEGDKVLDLYSYTGGFGIHAAVKKANVVMVEESNYAICEAKRNAKLNEVLDRCKIICGRVETYLEESNEKFDIVIADPPALIQSRERKKEGLIAYLNLYEAAIHKVKSGGLLVASSCSYFINEEEFMKMIWKAARRAERNLKLAGKVRGTSPCHAARPRDKHLMYLKVAFAIVN
mgnify:CR=1 FL=1